MPEWSQSNSPLVSVIMPCYNADAYIEEAVESVLNQSYQNIQLIIVDDFSTDKSAVTIRRLAAGDARIRAVYHQKNLGAARSRNTALDLAAGEFIAFLDADDVWMREKLECQINLMRRMHYDFVYSDYSVMSESGAHMYTLKCPGRLTRSKLLVSCFIGSSSVVISREMLGNNRQRDIACRNDYMFWLDLFRHGGIGFRCPGVLYRYRRGSGISSRPLRNFIFYCYVIRNATSYGLPFVLITFPAFMVVNALKKTCPRLYNKFVEII